MKFFSSFLILFAAMALFIGSCGENEKARSYLTKNEYEGAVAAWKLPEDWGENPSALGIMAGSFHVKTAEGPMGRIGVMPFRESVDISTIINMFAAELGHPDYNQTSILSLIQEIRLENRSFELVRLEDKKANTEPRSALLALYRAEGQTWLFPFVASRKLIDEQLENFHAFLSSTILRSGSTPLRAINPSPVPPSTLGHQPTWEAPDHWQRKPTTSIRMGNYVVSGESGESLDFSITSFPGDVGGILANVNRWLGQVGMDATDESGLSRYMSDRMIDEKPAKLVIAESNDQALYAAILFHEGRSWFLKLMGDRNLARSEKKNFIGLLDSFCLGDH